jgi:hypothetical protein
MSALTAKLGLPSALGLYVEDDALTLSQIVSTPLGPKQVACQTVPLDGERLDSALRRLAALPKQRRSKPIPIAIGLPPGRTYFATRPVQKSGAAPPPHVLLREALLSSKVSVQEMAVDVVEAAPDKRPVASIVAARRKYLQGIVDALGDYGVRIARTEPAACALVRSSSIRSRVPRRARVTLRVFLGDTELLAVLVAAGVPVVWRYVKLSRGDEAATVLSVSRSLLTVGKDCGVESPLAAVALHGRPDIKRLVDTDWLEGQLGASIDWHEEPSLDRSQVAFGLAAGCMSHDDRAIDLTRKMTPPQSLWQTFPWREIAAQVILLACMGLFLAGRLWKLQDESSAAQAHNSQYAWATDLRRAQLEGEKKELQQRASAVQKFLDSRVTWTDCARGVTARLPQNVFLTSLEACNKLESKAKGSRKGKPEKALVIRGAAPLTEDGSFPQEIDSFLDALREHPTLQKELPAMELADLQETTSRFDDDSRLASFTITCVPKRGK